MLSDKHAHRQEIFASVTDLLTFRADRDRYYYCADELFNRHPDIVVRLFSNTPSVIPNCSRA